MSTTDVLDDYLEELLLDIAAPSAAAKCTETAARVPVPTSAPCAVEPDPVVEEAISAATPLPVVPAVQDQIEVATPPLPAVEVAAPPAAQPVTAAHVPAPARHVPIPAPPAPVPSSLPSPSQNATWNELQAQALHMARPPQHRRAGERASRWLRLRCGAQAYALELLKVQEVVLPVPLLALRGTGPSMLGIMNLRGQVVPVIDLGLRLGAAPIEDDALTRIVVLEENGETLGLRVTAVEDVANLTDSQIEPPDTTRICQISNDLFRGIARLGQQPMILLDASHLLH